MQWSDAIATPRPKTLRQFAGLWLIVFGGMAAWRAWQGHVDGRTETLAVMALVVGVVGLVVPAAVRWIYTGWMVVAFPIGWTVSRLMIGIVFFVIFTPVALVFRLIGRDSLRLKKPDVTSYWMPKTGPSDAKEYFRLS